jgi:hypothetical protein
VSSWRDQILKEFTSKVARLSLVADPDALLLEERILEAIHETGFELISFEDHIAFRYAYESNFRSRWDRGEYADPVLVLRSQKSDLSSLPYDLLQAGRKLSFNLGQIFPTLSYRVVTALDRGDLDALYEAQARHAPGSLGDNATKEFILRHVFEIAPELIKQPSELLRVLLRRHYRGQRIPSILAERLIQLLRQNSTFNSWPLEIIIPDRELFFSFLQERWPHFLDREAAKEEARISEDEKLRVLAISGPVDLPFGHHDIRGYIDSLFLEGILHPVSSEHADTLCKSWLAIGIRTDPRGDRTRRLTRLIDNLQSSFPADEARHGDWFHFARGWAELVVLKDDPVERLPDQLRTQFTSLQAKVDTRFTAWLSKRYAGLVNLPALPPVMLHHLPRFIASQIEQDRSAKFALVIVDGLAMDQWLVVRGVLDSPQPRFQIREQAVFAWIPCLTSVSRQAAFAGKAPLFFPNSIQTTEREPSLWKQFWIDQGFNSNEVVYFKGLGEGGQEIVSEALSQPKVRVAGLVIDKVDKIMHGMEMGTAGMHNQVRQWAQGKYLSSLLDLLLKRDFRIYLTSDHGNIEAKGCGRPAEGSLADLRSERVRIYPDAALRRKVKERFPAALEWDPVGLPYDCLALLAPPRQAFVQQGQRTVSHGGISLEELIVPLVQIGRISE